MTQSCVYKIEARSPCRSARLNATFGGRREAMSGITIVTGCPGAGKTTLAHHASKREARGLHIPADVFYTFPAHPISPILPEAHEQNAAVIVAVSRTAAAFASRGYAVFLDGIIGPWFLRPAWQTRREACRQGGPVRRYVSALLHPGSRRNSHRARPRARAVDLPSGCRRA